MYSLICGDCLEVMRSMEDNSVDLVLCSPPYEAARSYGIEFNLRGDAWVSWAFERYMECVRVSRGLVAWVVEGQTRDFRWSATPALLMAELHRGGVRLRKPPIYARVGIPGSGGPDWWRNDYEFIICSSKWRRLPWSNNTATGHAPKYPPGGKPSHNLRDGRVNRQNEYKPPALANPGNIIRCHGGKGHMGSELSHENEAPFAEKLAESFILSFCPEGGTVLDPFCGSGTTNSVAERLGRNSIGIDLRQSQVELSVRRIAFDSEKGSDMAKKAPSPKAPAKPAKPMSGKASGKKSGKKSDKC